MKNYILLLLIMFIMVFISCSSKKSKQGYSSEKIPQENPQTIALCINPVLYKSLKSYLFDFNKDSYLKTNIFSVYFFKNNGKNYFTIWMSRGVPYNIIQNNPNVSFIFSLVKVLDASVILITEQGNDKLELLNCEFFNIDTLKEKITKSESIVSYDGSFFPETFEYKINKELVIKKADTLLVEFLGEDFIRYEKAVKSLKR